MSEVNDWLTQLDVFSFAHSGNPVLLTSGPSRTIDEARDGVVIQLELNNTCDRYSNRIHKIAHFGWYGGWTPHLEHCWSIAPSNLIRTLFGNVTIKLLTLAECDRRDISFIVNFNNVQIANPSPSGAIEENQKYDSV